MHPDEVAHSRRNQTVWFRGADKSQSSNIGSDTLHQASGGVDTNI